MNTSLLTISTSAVTSILALQHILFAEEMKNRADHNSIMCTLQSRHVLSQLLTWEVGYRLVV